MGAILGAVQLGASVLTLPLNPTASLGYFISAIQETAGIEILPSDVVTPFSFLAETPSIALAIKNIYFFLLYNVAFPLALLGAVILLFAGQYFLIKGYIFIAKYFLKKMLSILSKIADISIVKDQINYFKNIIDF